MSASTPPPDETGKKVTLDLVWEKELVFRGRSDQATILVDSDGVAGPSPVQALAFALAGCMATDVVHILKKGRLPLTSLRAELEGRRAPRDPKHLVSVRLHFRVGGDVPAEKVERAIALSRETYCSVWHSLRPDIDFVTSFEVA